MEITLNGEAFETGNHSNVGDLVQSLDLKGRRVAVMINEEVIKRDRWGEVDIRPGDAVEVIQMVGGG